MRPPPTRIGNGGRNWRTKASILPASTSSEIAAIAKSLRSNSRYNAAMWGNSSRQGSHHEAQKFTSVTFPRNVAVVSVSPARSGSAKAGANGSRAAGPAGAAATRETPARPPPAFPRRPGGRRGGPGVGGAPRHGPTQRVEHADERSTAGLGARELGDVIRGAHGYDAAPPFPSGRRVQRGDVGAVPLPQRAARGVEHHALAGALGDEQLGRAERGHGHRRREAGARELAHDVQPCIEGEDPALVGVGGPRATPKGSGRRAAEEEEGEAAGRRRATAESGCREHGAQGAAHQVAGETVLISIVCSPLTIRGAPATFTLPSTYCSG